MIVPARRGRRVPVALVIIALIVAAAIGRGLWRKAERQPAPSPPVITQAPAAPAPVPEPAPLTNDNIVDMVANNVAPSVIVGQIRTSKTNFNLSPAEVIRLTKASVPADVIEVMRDPNAVPQSVLPQTAVPHTGQTVVSDSPKITTPTSIDVALKDGAVIPLVLTEDIPADAAPGSPVHLKAVDDVMVGSSVVIRKGATASGAIVDAAPKKRVMGLGGRMTLRLDSVDSVDGHPVTIRATPLHRKEGASTRPVEIGPRKVASIAAPAGNEFAAYADGTNTITVKK